MRAASAVIALVIAVGASLILGPSAGAYSAAVPPAPACADGQAPVLFDGQWYCPGYVVGVKRTAYGVGARVVLQNVTVLGVTGATATVSGGPACLTPGTYCGATIPSVTISLSGLSVRPARGEIIDVYGVTGTKAMSAIGYVVKGSSSCDPAFC